MADTQRTTAALLVLLADNTSGAITPQHLRDVLVSLTGGYGGLCAAVAAGALSVGVTAVKITGWDTLQTQDGTVVVGNLTDDDLDVSVGGIYAVAVSVSFSGTADTTFTLIVYVNGVATNVKAIAKMDAAGAVQSVSLSGLLSITAADTVDLRVLADGAAKSLTLQAGALSLRRVN